MLSDEDAVLAKIKLLYLYITRSLMRRKRRSGTDLLNNFNYNELNYEIFGT